jgi:hypothetical protein
LRAELVRIMKFAGVTSVADIGGEYLERR